MPVCVSVEEMENTASFTETVLAAQEPVFVMKDGREAIVSMSPEAYESLLRKATRARLYDVVDCGLNDVQAGRTADAKSVTANLRAAYLDQLLPTPTYLKTTGITTGITAKGAEH